MVLQRSERFIALTAQQAAYLPVIERDILPGIVIPACQHPPAALGDDRIVRIQLPGCHGRIIHGSTEPHGNPVFLGLGADHALA
ncbi:hypothetical protein D3C80_1203870 [compost metagenome]